MTWKIVLAESPNQKTEAAACILRALPDWFGNIQARESYIEQSAALPVLIAYDRQQPIGFLALQETSPFACEICVMGVLPAYHRHGIGKFLPLRMILSVLCLIVSLCCFCCVHHSKIPFISYYGPRVPNICSEHIFRTSFRYKEYLILNVQ